MWAEKTTLTEELNGKVSTLIERSHETILISAYPENAMMQVKSAMKKILKETSSL